MHTDLLPRKEVDAPALFERIDPKQAGFDLTPMELTGALKDRALKSRLSSLEDSYQGVCLGDIDGDGRTDIYLAHPYGSHRLYRNLGGFTFEDVTRKAGLENPELWGKGAAFVDIDNDADLDLYVCGNGCPNALYINQGDGTFKEEAKAYGLDVDGFSIMMCFADIDLDGDLDAYLVTNQDPAAEANEHLEMKIRFKNGRAVVPEEYVDYVDVVVHPERGPMYVLAGQRDRLYLNNGDGTFSDISEKAGLFGGYMGLSATWFDMDNDRYPDLFVANDFYGADQLYRNNRDGTFTEVAWKSLPHTPWFSMGSDAADINNDGLLDLIATDMSGTSHYKSKMGMGDMEKDIWFLNYSQPRQYMRNAVYLNTGTDRFMEAAHMLGLANSDWTWSVKFGDLDSDGWNDLFICNGMTKDLTNSDYVETANHLKTSEAKTAFWQSKGLKEDRNMAFRNRGGLRFDNVGVAWGLDLLGVSLGSALGDLDGDGDPDLVVTGVREQITIYRNQSADHHLVKLRLKGTRSNRYGMGAMVTVDTARGRQVRYLNAAQGYLSANDPVQHVGLGSETKIDRLAVLWPSGQEQVFKDLKADRFYTVTEPETASPVGPRDSGEPLFVEVPLFDGVKHEENVYDDFKVQPLLPNKLSQ
ncbi:MAG: CRTAC1 family protein, partial [Verrucomicrobiota bacterium]